MANGSIDDSTGRDLAFKYYQEQWVHVRHHESLRSTLTFQVVGAAIAVIAGYLHVHLKDATSEIFVRMILSTILIALGLIGWIAVTRIERAAEIHIARGRAARKSIEVLEPFAAVGNQFPALRPVYQAFNLLIGLLGLCLLYAAPFVRTLG